MPLCAPSIYISVHFTQSVLFPASCRHIQRLPTQTGVKLGILKDYTVLRTLEFHLVLFTFTLHLLFLSFSLLFSHQLEFLTRSGVGNTSPWKWRFWTRTSRVLSSDRSATSCAAPFPTPLLWSVISLHLFSCRRNLTLTSESSHFS